MLNNSNYTWYKKLNKPFFTPSPIVFGIVWSILYPLIFISFGYVFYLFLKNSISFLVLLPFIVNLFSNLIFVPIQFNIKNNKLASLDILTVDLSLIWAIISIYNHSNIVALVQIPYLVWVLFATILQLSITYLN